MWKVTIAGGFFGLFISGCAFAPSQLNADASRYSGLTVVVRGYLGLPSQVRVLYDSRTQALELEKLRQTESLGSEENNHTKDCLNIANPELLSKNQVIFSEKMVTLRGKFIGGGPESNAIAIDACPSLNAIVIDNGDLMRRYRLLP